MMQRKTLEIKEIKKGGILGRNIVKLLHYLRNKLRIEYGRSSSTPNSIMTQQNVFQALRECHILPEPSHCDGHSFSHHAVHSWLGPVILFPDNNWMFRSEKRFNFWGSAWKFWRDFLMSSRSNSSSISMKTASV
jgi:hypothetical protein